MQYSKEKILSTIKEIVDDAAKIKPYVVIAQPRRNLDETPAQTLDGDIVCHLDLMGFSHGFGNVGGERVDVAREILINQAIESDAKYLLFVGDDTVMPFDGFLKLHEIAEKNPDSMAIGVYYIKASTPMIHVKKDNYIFPANVDPGQVFECYSAGLDAALIPISLLKKMKEADPDLPFTCIASGLKGETIGRKEEVPFIGEDNFFYHRWRKAGFKVLCNTDVQCLHMDLATGKYTAHPSVDLNRYFTNIQPTERLTLEDKMYLDKRWIDRIPKGSFNPEEAKV